jgi:LuxR family maltose regulon positive regulatory protein
MRNRENGISDLLGAGWAALADGAWDEARFAFESALHREESAEALEGLGWAAWWLNDIPVTFDARERAYRRYRESANKQAAGRMAVSLAADHYLRRGEHAVGNGWFQRAHRLLDGLDTCPEHAMLAIWESYVAVIFQHDTAAARHLGTKAQTIAASLGAVDLEMLAQASLGFATVCEGDVPEGMRLLDEATAAAVGGEMTDPDAIVTTCCYLISACERVRDYDRAAQWCDRAIRLADRWSYRFMFAYCRSHYAGVLIWRGAWREAEEELMEATGELATTFPAMAAEGIARLAELRRRQGRIEESHMLLEQLEANPLRALGGKLAMLGRATLALERGDATTAGQLAERYLRGVPVADQVERVDGLELLARAQATLGDHTQARQTAAELKAIASTIATPALWAKASFVDGMLAIAAGDHEAARRYFEDAVDMFERSGAPYETARSRLELAGVLSQLGHAQASATETQVARDALQRLGAAKDQSRGSGSARLTARELEVLRLVARGLSDKEIGAALGLSEHTAHRHVANILSKLDVPTRAAAVALTAHHHLL